MLKLSKFLNRPSGTTWLVAVALALGSVFGVKAQTSLYIAPPGGVTAGLASGGLNNTVNPGAYEFLLLSSEIGAAGTQTPITSMSFTMNGAPASDYTYTGMNVYVKNVSTSITTLAGSQPADNLAGYTQVFNGTLTVTGGAAVASKITFNFNTNTPFIYTGGNLQFLYLRTGFQTVAPTATTRGGAASGRARRLFSASFNIGTSALAAYNQPEVYLGFGTAVAQTPAISVSPTTLPDGLGASATASISGGTYYGSGVSYQWQQAVDAGVTPAAGAYSDVSGKTSSSASFIPTVSTWYRVGLTAGGVTNYSTGTKVSLAADGAAPTASDQVRCGAGTVTFNGTAANGGTLTWLTSSSPITPVATGSTFTTPSLASTTSYKVVETSAGSLFTTGYSASNACAASNGNYFNNYWVGDKWGYKFNVTASKGVIISNLDVIPGGAVGGAYQFELASSSGAIIGTFDGVTTVSAGNVETVNLRDIYLPPGTGYTIYGNIVPTGGFRTCDDAVPYPIVNANGVTITGSSNTADDPGVPAGIYSVRFKAVSTLSSAKNVTATVLSPPALTVTPATAATWCENSGGSVVLTATGGFDTYSWSPSTGLDNTNGQVVLANPNVTTTYTVTGHVNSTNCNSVTTQTVTVTPKITVSATSSASGTVCINTPVTLTASAFNTAPHYLGGTATGQAFYLTNFSNTSIRGQFIYSAAELVASGFTAGQSNPLSSLAFNYTTKGSTGSVTAFTIKIAPVASTTTTLSTYVTTGLQQVYAHDITTSLGLNTYTFDTPFIWDGTSSLVFDVCFNQAAGTASDQIATSTKANTGIVRSFLGCNNTTGTVTSDRPVIVLGGGAVVYAWSPSTNVTGGTSSSTLVVTPTSAGTTTYTITASSSNGCGYTATVDVSAATTPAAAVIALATPATTCSNDSVVINATGTTGQLQWQSAVDAGHTPADGDYADISGATASKLKVTSITSSTWYRVVASCPGAPSGANSNAIKATAVNNPVASGTDQARCETGAVTLSGTGTGTLRWTNKTFGGQIVGSGASFTTPTITSTTNYGVFATTNETTTNVGRATKIVDLNLLNATYGLFFDVLKPEGVIINSVDIYPAGPIGSTYQIQILASDNTILADITGVTTVAATQKQVVAINTLVPSGTNYRIMAPQYAGGLGTFVANGTVEGSTKFPFKVPSVLNITAGDSAGGFHSKQGYYYFYNWSISYGCYSSVAPVAATVIVSSNTLSVSTNKSVICLGSPATATISSTGYSHFAWSPSTGVTYTPGATTAFLNPSTSTTYTFTADDGNPDPIARCSKVVTIPIIVNTVPTVTLVSPASPCVNVANTIVASGSSSATVKVGTGTAAASMPFTSNTLTNRSQALYKASELASQGFTSQTSFNALALTLSNKSSNGSFANFSVRITGVPITTDSLNLATGLLSTASGTQVFSGSVATTFGTNKITFSTPFIWNGTDNILVEFCYSNAATLSLNNDFVLATTFTPARAVTSTGGCGTAATTATATNNRPNITLFGGSVDYTFTSANSGTNSSPIGLITVNPATPGSVSFSPVVAGTYNYIVTVKDGANCTASAPITLTAENVGRWVGGTSTDYSNAANWNCGVIPGASDDITVPAGRANYPALTTAATVTNLTIAANAKLNVVNPGSITLTGNFSNLGGFFTAAPGTAVTFAGTSQTITAIGTTKFNDLVVSGGSVTNATDSKVGVINTLSITGAGTYTNSGTTTLISNENGTARLGKLNSASAYSGSLTVQRYLPASLVATGQIGSNVLVGLPFANTTLSDLQSPVNQFFNFPGAPGAAAGPYSSVYFYNPDSADAAYSGWVMPTSINQPFTAGIGARVFFSGAFFTTGNTNSVTGTLPASTTYPITLKRNDASTNFVGGNGWNIVGNPVPSEISWKSSAWSGKENVGSAIYIWQQANKRYSVYSYAAGTADSTNGGTGIIGSGQAFFVKALTDGAVLTATEDVKDASTTAWAGIQRFAANYRLVAKGTSPAGFSNEAVIGFRSDATNGYDHDLDAHLLAGTAVNVATLAGNEAFAINRMAVPTQATTVPVLFTSAEKGIHTLSFTGLNGMVADGYTVSLKDNFTGTITELIEGAPVSFTITTDSRSQGNGRFVLVFTPSVATGVPANLNQASFSIRPNPATSSDVTLNFAGFSDQTAALVRVIDAVGKEVSSRKVSLVSGLASEKLNLDLQAGVYTVICESTGRKLVQKLVIQ